MQESSVTLVGNLTADPQLRNVASGAAVCSIRIGCTPRWRNRETGLWQDGTSMFVSVSCWRALALNVAHSVRKGDRVVVVGRLRQRTFTTTTGEERQVWEVDADTVAPDLNRHVCLVTKVGRDRETPEPLSPEATATQPEPQGQELAA